MWWLKIEEGLRQFPVAAEPLCVVPSLPPSLSSLSSIESPYKSPPEGEI